MKLKRMIISLIIASFFGIFCAYGTSNVKIPGFEITFPYLITIFYGRLLIGLVIGLSEDVKLLKSVLMNSILRGAIMGAIVSIGISFYGGAIVFIGFGMVYGAITDLLATKLGS